MTIHEFGCENPKTLLLIHPSVVKWDYFETVIPLLQKDDHLLIPALPGYDFEDDSDFTSVEQIASELNAWLQENSVISIRRGLPMRITMLATLTLMLAYFLILYGGVAFIQDKRFFGFAPKENLAAIPDRKERFLHFALYIPLSATLAWVCTLL